MISNYISTPKILTIINDKERGSLHYNHIEQRTLGCRELKVWSLGGLQQLGIHANIQEKLQTDLKVENICDASACMYANTQNYN